MLDEPRDIRGKVLAGRYRLVAPLGEGGMAWVYSAENLAGRGHWDNVAVKLVRTPYGANRTRARLFDREVRAAATLSHPNIIQIIDTGRDAHDRPFLVMELVHGVPLDEIITSVPLPVPVVIYVMRRILRAVAHAHAHDILHRDISPANVLVTLDGEVKLTDFGLAKFTTDDAPSSPGLKGKTGYIAPELIHEENRTADIRCDLYAIGALFYRVATGRLPFGLPFEAARYMALAVKPDPPNPPSRYRKGFPPELDTLVLSLLAHDPARRPPHANAVIESLASQPECTPEALAAHVREARDARPPRNDGSTLIPKYSTSAVPPRPRKPPARNSRRPLGHATTAIVAAFIGAAATLYVTDRDDRVASTEPPTVESPVLPSEPHQARENPVSPPVAPVADTADELIELLDQLEAMEVEERHASVSHTESARHGNDGPRKVRTQSKAAPPSAPADPSPSIPEPLESSIRSSDRPVWSYPPVESTTRDGRRDRWRQLELRQHNRNALRFLDGDDQVWYGYSSKNDDGVELTVDVGRWENRDFQIRFYVTNGDHTTYTPAECRVEDRDGNLIAAGAVFRVAQGDSDAQSVMVPPGGQGKGVVWIRRAAIVTQPVTLVISETQGKRAVRSKPLRWW